MLSSDALCTMGASMEDVLRMFHMPVRVPFHVPVQVRFHVPVQVRFHVYILAKAVVWTHPCQGSGMDASLPRQRCIRRYTARKGREERRASSEVLYGGRTGALGGALI
eukprot:365231-Chlamydomonas_euryale.AAC.12